MKCLWRLLYAFRSPVSRSFGQQSTVRPSQVKMAPYQGRETCFKCLKEEKEQAQPQLYGTQYFSVRIALTGHLQYWMADSRYFWVVTRSTSPAILTGVREQEGTEQATSHHTSRPPDARMKR